MSQKPGEGITPMRGDKTFKKSWKIGEGREGIRTAAAGARGSGLELDVPIGVADDALPGGLAGNLREKELRGPTRSPRPAKEPEPGLFHQAISLLEIARQAGDDAVLPMGSSAA
jgi:hypothetical protein